MSFSGAILLVDPFADEQDMYAEFLRFNGFELLSYADPLAAIEAARAGEVAAIVTRIRQPGATDGIELTRRIKSDHRTTHIPVVIITTYMEAAMQSRAVEAGCDAFLRLPCLPEELLAELRRLVRPSSTPFEQN